MPSRDIIRTRVSENLNDAGLTFYTNIDLNDSIQDGYDEVVALAQPIELMISLNWISLLSYYNFATLITRYLRTFAIFNNNNNRWLEAKDLLFFRSLRSDWELASGDSQYFAPLDFKWNAFFPRQTLGSGTFDVFYKAKANILSGFDIPVIPLACENILEFYATADLLEQAEEYTKAQEWWDRYFQSLEVCKLEVQKRSLPDRIIQLREQFA